MRWRGSLFILGLVAAVQVVYADDRADLEGTQIIGSRELPKVLYIVPWRPPQTGELVGRPVESLLDEALAPVDREVFQRQVQYHDAFREHPVAKAKP
jgi:hypothetical protein